MNRVRFELKLIYTKLIKKHLQREKYKLKETKLVKQKLK